MKMYLTKDETNKKNFSETFINFEQVIAMQCCEDKDGFNIVILLSNDNRFYSLFSSEDSARQELAAIFNLMDIDNDATSVTFEKRGPNKFDELKEQLDKMTSTMRDYD